MMHSTINPTGKYFIHWGLVLCTSFSIAASCFVVSRATSSAASCSAFSRAAFSAVSLNPAFSLETFSAVSFSIRAFFSRSKCLRSFLSVPLSRRLLALLSRGQLFLTLRVQPFPWLPSRRLLARPSLERLSQQFPVQLFLERLSQRPPAQPFPWQLSARLHSQLFPWQPFQQLLVRPSLGQLSQQLHALLFLRQPFQ